MLGGNRQELFLGSWQPYFWIVLAGFLLYFQVLFFGLTYLDDQKAVLGNPFIGRGEKFFAPTDIWALFKGRDLVTTGEKQLYYRPLGGLFFMLNARLGGQNPFFYHLTNLLLHLLASGLVFSLLVNLGYSRPVSFTSSLIFAVHPVLTNSVSWIIGQVDLLVAVFSLAAFICFLRFLNQGGFRTRPYILHLFFFGLAVLSKENAFALPLVCILYFSLFQTRGLKNLLVLILGWSLIGLGWLLLRQSAMTNPMALDFNNVLKSLGTSLPALILYFGKTVLPFNLSVLPVLKDSSFVFGIAAVILALTALWLSKNKNMRLVIFGLCWFLLFLLPCFIRPDAQFAFFLESRIYPALFGIFLIFLSLFPDPGSGKFLILVPVFLLFCFISFTYSRNFKDRMTFWQSAVKSSPHSPLAQRNLGAMYYLDGLYDQAEKRFKEALAINPYEPMAYNNLGLIYMRKGLDAQAEAAFKKELSFNPDYDDANFNLGLLYYREGKIKEAIGLWKKTLEINPNHTGANECIRKMEKG